LQQFQCARRWYSQYESIRKLNSQGSIFQLQQANTRATRLTTNRVCEVGRKASWRNDWYQPQHCSMNDHPVLCIPLWRLRYFESFGSLWRHQQLLVLRKTLKFNSLKELNEPQVKQYYTSLEQTSCLFEEKHAEVGIRFTTTVRLRFIREFYEEIADMIYDM
jgi:hypothetical protein